MGAVLDSSENIRQRAKSSSRKAHCRKEKLEKDKIKGVKMAESHGELISEKFANRIVDYVHRYGLKNETYNQLEKKLAKIVDKIAKDIDDPDTFAKIKEFKKIAFYEKEEIQLTEFGLDGKTAYYLKSIQKVFKNGSN